MSEEQIRALLQPYLVSLPAGYVLPQGLFPAMSAYLELLLKWNARTNLTAVRAPEEIVHRHFGESLFAGGVLARYVRAGGTVLDLGSGAGFPGLPVQLLLPHVHVTLAESQGKKAAFLREAVRVLGLTSETWAARVESMHPDRLFDAVTMRAVDRMQAMEAVGRQRLAQNGLLVRLTTHTGELGTRFPIPGSAERFVEVVPAAH